MARFGFVAALAGIFLGALVLLQLIAITWEAPAVSHSRSQAQFKGRENQFASDDSIFLLGAGKADITG